MVLVGVVNWCAHVRRRGQKYNFSRYQCAGANTHAQLSSTSTYAIHNSGLRPRELQYEQLSPCDRTSKSEQHSNPTTRRAAATQVCTSPNGSKNNIHWRESCVTHCYSYLQSHTVDSHKNNYKSPKLHCSTRQKHLCNNKPKPHLVVCRQLSEHQAAHNRQSVQHLRQLQQLWRQLQALVSTRCVGFGTGGGPGRSTESGVVLRVHGVLHVGVHHAAPPAHKRKEQKQR
jgi:hypothetical protein